MRSGAEIEERAEIKEKYQNAAFVSKRTQVVDWYFDISQARR